MWHVTAAHDIQAMMTCPSPCCYHIQYGGELTFIKNKIRVYVNLMELTKVSRH